MLPIAAEIAARVTREQAQSALPNAPVMPVEEESRPPVSLLFRVLAVTRRAGRRGQSSGSAAKPRHAW